MAVTYITRDGTKIDGTTGQDHLLEVIYGHALTRMLLRPFLSPAVSDICGKFLSTRLSRRIIPSFVKKNHIDLGIYEKQEFDSYNAFFTRKIKAEQRPINEQKNILISPSDGKVTAYPITQKGRFWIKHTQYSAAQLLKDERLAGSALLSPTISFHFLLGKPDNSAIKEGASRKAITTSNL